MAVALATATLLSGCGSSSLSDAQLRTRASRICQAGRRRTDRITQPTLPAQGARFIRQGITALAPAEGALARLRPPDDLRDEFRAGLGAFSDELTVMRSALRGLQDGNDPVVAIKSLQQGLTTPEGRAAGAWGTLGLPDCSALTG